MNIKVNLDWLMRGWLMSMLVSYDLKYGVELGTYMGGTAFFLLNHIPGLTLHTVDIFEQQADHENYGKQKYDFTERYPELMKMAQRYDGRLIIHKGWTHEVATQFEPGSLDFVFVDADHTYAGCKLDITTWKPKIKPGGLMMGHDTHMAGVQKAVTECFEKYTIWHGTFCWVVQL